MINKVEIPLHSLQAIKLILSHDVLVLLLQPKWLVKLERCFFMKKKKQYIMIISKHLSKILIKSKQYKRISKITIDALLDLKNIQLKKWLNKIDYNSSTIKWIFSYLIKHKYIKNTFIGKDYIFYSTNKNELDELFKVIYFTGLEWFLYTNKKSKVIYIDMYIAYQQLDLVIVINKHLINIFIQCISHFINWQTFNLKKLFCNIYQQAIPCFNINTLNIKQARNIEYLIKPNKQLIKSLVSNIRSKIYYKNQDGYWRRRNHLSIERIMPFIKFILKYWYSYYFSTIDTLDILELNRIVDNMLYLWQTKK